MEDRGGGGEVSNKRTKTRTAHLLLFFFDRFVFQFQAVAKKLQNYLINFIIETYYQ